MRWGSEDKQLLGAVVYCAVEALKISKSCGMRQRLPLCQAACPLCGELDFFSTLPSG